MEEKEKKEQEKGFTIRDKRFSAKPEEETQVKGEEKAESRPDETESKEATFKTGRSSEENIPLPEINFPNFILSLSTSALIQLGEIQDPITGQAAKNLPLAKQTIDLIAMMKEKTKGNLTPDESKMMEAILYDLRMRYIKAAG